MCGIVHEEGCVNIVSQLLLLRTPLLVVESYEVNSSNKAYKHTHMYVVYVCTILLYHMYLPTYLPIDLRMYIPTYLPAYLCRCVAAYYEVVTLY